MGLCKPCRHDNHEACKRGSYKQNGCSCTSCGPHKPVIPNAKPVA